MSFIRKVKPFSHLEVDEIRELAELISDKEVYADEDIFLQNSASDACYFLESGNVDIIRDGKTITTLNKGIKYLFNETGQVPINNTCTNSMVNSAEFYTAQSVIWITYVFTNV